MSTSPAAGTNGPTAPVAASDGPPKRRWVKWAVIGVLAVLIVGFIGSLGRDDDGIADASPTATVNAPSEDADPTATPRASPPEATPDLTPQATPEPTPEVTLEPSPEFEDVALSGTGNAVPRFDIPVGAAAIAEIAYSGGSNFAVWAVDASGAQTDLLVNTIGSYTGTVLFDEQDGSHTAAFEVEASGPWTITIRPVAAAFRWDGSEALGGTGDDVAILDPASSGLRSTNVTHTGEGNFAIWGYSTSGFGTDLLVNEIGNYSGEVLLSGGTFLFEITATGSWTMSPPQ